MKSVETKVASVSDYFIYTPSKTAQNLFFYPIQCGIFTYEPGYLLQRNSLNSFLLMYIQRGEMWLRLFGQEIPVPQGSFVLLDCYQPHSYGTEEGAECTWLHFDGKMARDYCQLIISRLGNVFSMEDAFPVLRRLNAILRVFLDRQTVQEPLMSKRIIDILTEFMLYTPHTNYGRSYAGVAQRSINYISEHFTEDIPIGQLASLTGLSPFHFSRIFKQETGYTPHEYIINRRMASARYLLRFTDLTVKEIYFNTGYSSESIFCNAFKKYHGMTPQQYRLQGSGDEPAPAR